MGTLFVQGRWALAISPEAGRGEANWNCGAEERYGPTFVGSTETLRDAVTAILAGRETTILARAAGAVERPRQRPALAHQGRTEGDPVRPVRRFSVLRRLGHGRSGGSDEADADPARRGPNGAPAGG